MSEWDDFISLAWRTTTGIRTFSDEMADYVTSTIAEYEDPAMALADDGRKLDIAEVIISAIDETKDVYRP